MRSNLIHVRVRPSEYEYLLSFTSISEGVRFVIRESMNKNLTPEQRQFANLTDNRDKETQSS